MAHEEKLIDYLSKEIETQTNSLMTFRSRINFAVFVGPFVLLGATLYGKGITINWSALPAGARAWLLVFLLFIILSYLTMGVACSVIEVHIWEQCNKWRKRIAELSRGHETGFTYKQLEFEERLAYGYYWVYGAMIVAFGSATAIILILQAYAPPAAANP